MPPVPPENEYEIPDIFFEPFRDMELENLSKIVEIIKAMPRTMLFFELADHIYDIHLDRCINAFNRFMIGFPRHFKVLGLDEAAAGALIYQYFNKDKK